MLAHELHGSGPPIVFLHGLAFTGRTWLPIVERLAGYVRVVVDLPGHGGSAGPPTTQNGLVCRLRERASSSRLLLRRSHRSAWPTLPDTNVVTRFDY